MAQMKLEIGGRSFTVTCQDGEEDHLSKLADMVDGKAREFGDTAGLTESRMLLYSALQLADELYNAQAAPAPAATSGDTSPPGGRENQIVAALEKLADRTEQLANSLE
jgi:cell division protein ZapA